MFNAVKTWHAAGVLALSVLLAGCNRADDKPTFIAEGLPAKLSAWHMLKTSAMRVELNAGVLPYDLNTPLFSDYAHKLRTVWMPGGVSATYKETEPFDFPVGTVISKTFYYPKQDGRLLQTADTGPALLDGRVLDLSRVRLIETRLLVRREAGWVALPYVWNAEQTEATLSRTGDQTELTLSDENGQAHPFTYVVPNENQCASCHVAKIKGKDLQPIGLKARHLNRPFVYGTQTENQLEHLVRAGYLSGLPAGNGLKGVPHNADWRDTSQPLDARARAYLDINCAHCHNPVGAANNTGLNLEPFLPPGRTLGLCKPPVAAGKGTGDRGFGIVPGHPELSIMSFRLASTEGGIMMPELGRSTVHAEGLKLIEQWIQAMPGECTPADKS